MATNAEHEARWRAKRPADGFVPVTVWEPSGAAACLAEAAEKMRADPDLRIGPLVNQRTGKMVGRKRSPL